MALDRQLKTLVKDRVDRSLVGKPGRAMRMRMYVTVIVTLVALGWWGLSGGAITGRGRATLYSPGHVTPSHASFENECWKCHQGDQNGNGFRQHVTDEACMQCHDGSMHHRNQLRADSPAGVSREKRILAISFTGADGAMAHRSADCVSCHVEHRSAELLAGLSDEHCTVCHTSVASASAKPGDVKIQDKVVAFTESAHPPFGRRLIGTFGEETTLRPIDRTDLKFNHVKHLTSQKAMGGLSAEQSCVMCHETTTQRTTFPLPAVTAEGDEKVLFPPYGPPINAGAPVGEADLRYIRPISYQRHCIGCHSISVADSRSKLEDADLTPVMTQVVGPHAPLPLLEQAFAARVRKTLAEPDEKFVIGEETIEGADERRKKWLEINLGLYAEEAGATAPSELPDNEASVRAIARAMAQATMTKGTGSCVKCHSMEGDMPSELAHPLDVVTKPTGITASLRVWYAGSRFDHRAHRDMNCTSCHNGFADVNVKPYANEADETKIPPSLRETSYLHLPGLTWREGTGESAKVRSCVECHHPDTSSARGAGSRCVTCHDFHDRTLERPLSVLSPPAEPKATEPLGDPTPAASP